MSVAPRAAICFVIHMVSGGNTNMFAHVPLFPKAENTTPGAAVRIQEPTKSWVIYSSFSHTSQMQYYQVDLRPGERLVLALFTPVGDGGTFEPSLSVRGPGTKQGGVQPDDVAASSDLPASAVNMVASERLSYEPFTPSALYYVKKVDFPVSERGTYLIAVGAGTGQGRFGLAVGYREIWRPEEWIFLSLTRIRIYQWEGRSLGVLFTPTVIVMLLGFAILAGKRRSLLGTVYGCLNVVAGLLCMASGLMTMSQAVRGAILAPEILIIITLMIGLAQTALGVVILRLLLTRATTLDLKGRLMLLLLAIIGFVTWAGFLVGPVATAATALLPTSKGTSD